MGRVVIIGTLAYGALVLVLRISGKRTLSKMNAFDLVVTVALGSTRRPSFFPRMWLWLKACLPLEY